MDLARAARGAVPFSDEGDVALALTTGRAGRACVVLLALVPAVWLTVAAARAYRFERGGALKALAVYALTLTVGIAAVLLDDLLGFRGV